ncbi:MAG: hypothetical protein LBS99_03325 [Clostridiales bacterium]|nr:hypothetical protein [Clostridiales bacterium]
MYKKYNWVKLRREFIVGNCKTLKEFAEKKKIPYEVVRVKAPGWRCAKETINKQNQNKIEAKILAAQVKEEVDRNTRHLRVGDNFLEFVEQFTRNALETASTKPEIGIEGVERLIRIAERVQKMQRLALGLDRDKQEAAGMLPELTVLHVAAEQSEAEVEAAVDGSREGDAYDNDGVRR